MATQELAAVRAELEKELSGLFALGSGVWQWHPRSLCASGEQHVRFGSADVPLSPSARPPAVSTLVPSLPPFRPPARPPASPSVLALVVCLRVRVGLRPYKRGALHTGPQP
jgi:hypothetical protein